MGGRDYVELSFSEWFSRARRAGFRAELSKGSAKHYFARKINRLVEDGFVVQTPTGYKPSKATTDVLGLLKETLELSGEPVSISSFKRLFDSILSDLHEFGHF